MPAPSVSGGGLFKDVRVFGVLFSSVLAFSVPKCLGSLQTLCTRLADFGQTLTALLKINPSESNVPAPETSQHSYLVSC